MTALGLDADEETDRGKIKDGRQDADNDDDVIGDLRVGGHDEGPGAHDRRHQLATGRGRGFDPGGKLGRETGTLHQRDGDHAGRGGVGNRRTGDGAHQPGGHDRHQAGAADHAPGDGAGQVDDELTGAGTEQKGTEQDEHEHVAGRDAGDGAEQGVVTVDAAEQNGFRAQTGKFEDPADLCPPPANITQGDDDQHRDKPAGHPPGEFQGTENQDDAGHPLAGEHAYAARVDGVFHGDQVESRPGGEKPQQDIQGSPDDDGILAQRVDQRGHQGKAGKMQRVLPERRQHCHHVEPDVHQ